MPSELTDALSKHPKWPVLGTKDWQEVAQQVLGHNGKLPSTDTKYNVIRKHCDNARTKHNAQKSAVPAPTEAPAYEHALNDE